MSAAKNTKPPIVLSAMIELKFNFAPYVDDVFTFSSLSTGAGTLTS
jgi:hypothetical protein